MKSSLITLLLLVACAIEARAATTINAANKYSYGANLGWIDWRGDTNQGAVIGEYVCSGYIYSANVGWINLGSGSPANGIYYQNLAASDFGVNQDGLGNLRGFAYGANLGWINFETNGAPKVDLKTGRLSGLIYSANAGWISLSNAYALVQTDSIRPGTDSDGDGIADAWELIHFGNLATANATSDFDHDGQTDKQEYLADTDPLNNLDYLRITHLDTNPAGAFFSLTWTSKPTRFYQVLETTDLFASFSTNLTLNVITPDPGLTTTRTATDLPAPDRFFRVQALRPLAP